jgi:hypothetical protein
MSSSNGKAPPPYFDNKQNAMVQEDIHLMPENKAAAVQKKYHTYCVADLEKNVESLDDNIKVFHEHIAKEKARKEELLVLIAEGKERDEKLKALGM